MEGLRIETDRLVLRPMDAVDFEGWAALFADPQATRFLGGPRGPELAWRHFLSMAGAWRIQGFSTFSVLDRDTEQWLGWVGPWYPLGWPGGEVGWCFSRQSWGQGYAVEAVTAAIDWVFDYLDWADVIHCIAPGHEASQAVARRLGSTQGERISMPPPFEGQVADLWSQSRHQWQLRRAQR